MTNEFECKVCGAQCSTYTSLLKHISTAINSGLRKEDHENFRFMVYLKKVKSVNTNFNLLTYEITPKGVFFTIHSDECGHTFTTRSDSIKCNHKDCQFKNRSIGNKNQNTPEVRKKKSEAMKQLYQERPELIEQKAEISKELWKSDEYRNKIVNNEQRNKNISNAWALKFHADLNGRFQEDLNWYLNNGYELIGINGLNVVFKHSCGNIISIYKYDFLNHKTCDCSTSSNVE